MSLNNFFFVPFLAMVLAVYGFISYVLREYADRAKVLYCLLVIASYGFICITNIYFGVILLVTSLIAYFAAIGVEKSDTGSF